MKKLHFTLLLAAALAVCTPAAAQDTGGISLVRVSLDEHLPVDVNYGENFSLQIAGAHRIPSNFHVRIFRGNLNYLTKSMKAYADPDGCITFSTVLLWGQVDSAIHMQAFADLGWLKIDSQNRFEAEDLTLVFESGDSPVASRIRIHKTQLADYFRYAVPIRLNPTALAQSASVQIAQATQQELKDTRMRFQAVPPGPCYQVQELAAIPDNGLSQVARLQATDCSLPQEEAARVPVADTAEVIRSAGLVNGSAAFGEAQ